MNIFQTDGKWYAVAEGYTTESGSKSKRSESRVGPFDAMPVPVAKWYTMPGSGSEKLQRTGFSTSGNTSELSHKKDFILEEIIRYDGKFVHETVYGCDMVIPTMGESYRWTGDGWESVAHPQIVE